PPRRRVVGPEDPVEVAQLRGVVGVVEPARPIGARRRHRAVSHVIKPLMQPTTQLTGRASRGPPGGSEVAALGLLALDRLEECLEVALAEPERAMALDDLEEHRGSVAERLGEDLQEVAVLVAVDENATPLQLL